MNRSIGRNKPNENGLTLIEVLASLLILGLLAVSVTSIFIPASTWIYKARTETTASNYAFSILETFRADRSKLDSSHTGKSAQNIFPESGFPWAGMSDEINRMEPQAPPYEHLYDITVTVSWIEGNTVRHVQMSTIMRKD